LFPEWALGAAAELGGVPELSDEVASIRLASYSPDTPPSTSDNGINRLTRHLQCVFLGVFSVFVKMPPR
jgi:hypothetical protein